MGSSATTDSGGREFAPIHLADPVRLWDLPTPALVVTREALEANLRKMAGFFRDKAAGIRPHTKTHKCPILAHKQMELGAVGICTAKVSEAEVMVEAGIGEVLITSPVVTRDKIDRVMALARRSSGLAVVVDQPENVRHLNQAAATADTRLSVFLDLNVGTDRTGVAAGEPALETLREIGASPSLRFAGILAYAGHLQHWAGWKNRRPGSLEVLARALEVTHLAEKEGFDVPAFRVGGTGTYDIDCDVEGVTDVQVGSYLFMDVNYRNVGGKNGPVFDDFEPALLVLATAISQPVPGRITVDAGCKAFATDEEAPELLDIQGVEFHWAGDEHGILELVDPSRQIRIGDKVLLIASHCDPTVNLYDNYYAFRGETVEEVWPIAARGCSQ